MRHFKPWAGARTGGTASRIKPAVRHRRYSRRGTRILRVFHGRDACATSRSAARTVPLQREEGPYTVKGRTE